MKILIALQFSKEKSVKNIEKLLSVGMEEANPKIEERVSVFDLKINYNSYEVSFLTNIITCTKESFEIEKDMDNLDMFFENIIKNYQTIFPFYKETEFVGCVLTEVYKISDLSIDGLNKKEVKLNYRDTDKYNYNCTYKIEKESVTVDFDINTRFVIGERKVKITELIKKIKPLTEEIRVREAISDYVK